MTPSISASSSWSATPRRSRWHWLAVVALALAGCTTPNGPAGTAGSRNGQAGSHTAGSKTGQSGAQGQRVVPQLTPEEQVLRYLPAGTRDARGWAKEIATAFKAQKLTLDADNICAVLAVAEQESGLHGDPVVPGLPTIAWDEIDRRAKKMMIPPMLVHAALLVKSPNGQSYSERLDHVRTERDLSEIFDDMIGMVPMGQKLFGRLNPVHTAGPMQVSIAFAEAHRDGYPYPVPTTIRNEVFTRRGGLYFGTYHLLNYPVGYSRPLYRFADFNAGWYASRNAAFQAAINRVTGARLDLDGDLIQYGSDEASATERALQGIAGKLDLDDGDIRDALKKGQTRELENTTLYRRLYALAEKRAGHSLPREMLPGIKLESPKITRQLTTAWFAQRVDGRHAQCLARGR